MRSISRVYTQWKQAWQAEQRLKEQKQRALLFWALQLQKRVTLNSAFRIAYASFRSVLSPMVDLYERAEEEESAVQ